MSVETVPAGVSLISPDVLESLDALHTRFVTNKPFRHVAIPGFFLPRVAEALLAEFPKFDEEHALNEMGQVGGKAVRTDVRRLSPAFRALDDSIQTAEFLGTISRITGIPDLVFDPDYIGGGTHENRDGQGLDPHIDFNYHPANGWHRRLNLIVYLNSEWESEWGGELELHSDPWNEDRNLQVRISPKFNSCVIFETTEFSWHGFARIRLPPHRPDISRKSFAIYLYTRARPAEEVAAPHATVYVPPAMPSGWEPGRALSHNDIEELQNRFGRLTDQLRFLYNREMTFATDIERFKQALAEARSALRLDVQGYAIQRTAPRGFWPDGWAGTDLAAEVIPARRARALQMELWVPPELAPAQSIRVDLNGVVHEKLIEAGAVSTWNIPFELESDAPLQILITAARHWTPSSGGVSKDDRELAYKIVKLVLSH